MVVMQSAELVVQTINVAFYCIPNAYSLAHRCSWVSKVVVASALIRHACWPTVSAALLSCSGSLVQPLSAWWIPLHAAPVCAVSCSEHASKSCPGGPSAV